MKKIKTVRHTKPLKIETARLKIFDYIFVRPTVFEEPFPIPVNARLQLVFKCKFDSLNRYKSTSASAGRLDGLVTVSA